MPCVTCPWRGFLDPVVQDVLDAYKFWETGQLSFWLPDPPNHIVEGILVYHQSLKLIEADDLLKERKARGRSND